jgi:hypothetical protein
MNNGTPTNPFKKGNPGGPGRPKLPEDLKIIKNSTKDNLYKTFYKFQAMKKEQLQEINLEDITLLEMGILKSFKNFIETGDYNTIKYPLDHIIGKARESLDLNAGGSVQLVISQDFVLDSNSNSSNADSKSE